MKLERCTCFFILGAHLSRTIPPVYRRCIYLPAFINPQTLFLVSSLFKSPVFFSDPKLGSSWMVMTLRVPISWGLCILSLNPRRANAISEWNECLWWNFRHHAVAAVGVTLGQCILAPSECTAKAAAQPTHLSLMLQTASEAERRAGSFKRRW